MKLNKKKKAFTESHSDGFQPSRMDTAVGTSYRDTSKSIKADVATSNITDNFNLYTSNMRVNNNLRG